MSFVAGIINPRFEAIGCARSRAESPRTPEEMNLASSEPKRPVVFSGENSMIRLFRPGGDEIIAAASYWRCTYSEHGEGNALVIWTDPSATGLGDVAPHAIYADN